MDEVERRRSQSRAALVPRPRLNLIRFQGILAPNAKWRSMIVPVSAKEVESLEQTEPGEKGKGKSSYYMSWSLSHILVLRDTWTSLSNGQLLRRVFDIDVTTCSECGGQLKITAPAHPCARGFSASMHVITAILDPPAVRRMLTHLGLSANPPPRFPARYDPYQEAELY